MTVGVRVPQGWDRRGAAGGGDFGGRGRRQRSSLFGHSSGVWSSVGMAYPMHFATAANSGVDLPLSPAPQRNTTPPPRGDVYIMPVLLEQISSWIIALHWSAAVSECSSSCSSTLRYSQVSFRRRLYRLLQHGFDNRLGSADAHALGVGLYDRHRLLTAKAIEKLVPRRG